MVHYQDALSSYRPCGNHEGDASQHVNAVTCGECLYHVITGQLETTAYPLEVLQGIAAQLTSMAHRV